MQEVESQDEQFLAIVTAYPDEESAEVHARVPVTLHAADCERWLRRGPDHPPVDTLRLYDGGAATLVAWNPLVRDVRTAEPEMLRTA